MLKRGLVVSSLLATLLYFAPSPADAKITNESISEFKRIVVTATPSPTVTPSAAHLRVTATAGSEEVAELEALVEEKKSSLRILIRIANIISSALTLCFRIMMI